LNPPRLEKNQAIQEGGAFERILWALGFADAANIETEKTGAPAIITALANRRWAAKQAKDFAAADALRKELTAAGWSMLDGKDGYKLEKLKG
jgi:cysteinyl-tRNA synthetase